jgi:hypothetical protein
VNGVKPVSSPSVEFSNIVNRVKGVKRVKPVKKLRGVGLEVELGFTMHGISIESGVICISFYKGQYDMQIVNNLANLLNFSITGWWA